MTVALIDTDPYFRRRPVNVHDEQGVLTCDTEPWKTVDEFEQCCDLVDAFQKETQHRGVWTTRGYFEMLAWGKTKEGHRAIANDLLNSSKRNRRGRGEPTGEAKRRKPRNDGQAIIRQAVKNFDDPDVREALRLTTERAETDPEARQAIERIRAIEELLRSAVEHLNSEKQP